MVRKNVLALKCITTIKTHKHHQMNQFLRLLTLGVKILTKERINLNESPLNVSYEILDILILFPRILPQVVPLWVEAAVWALFSREPEEEI